MKTLASMQPYFFPYLGYFSLIKYCDKFILFDTAQYIRRGWCNRNRILKQDGTPTYIVVPIQKTSYETPINKILIDNKTDWRSRIFGQLNVYKKKAPNYRRVIDFLHGILDCEHESLSELCISTTKAVCEFLGISADFCVFSEMDLGIDDVNAPDEWALFTAKALGYDCYVNPPGGMSFYDSEKYAASGIRLEFLALELVPYDQRLPEFVPGLSVIDAMMFCSSEEISALLDRFSLLS